jgi:arginyl-tRNA--protein-N-Asp/Glu arginylyltransferase
MTAQFRFPRFFVTTPGPCPYLPGRTERKVFTELAGPNAGELNDALGRIGFRRSQGVAYRPTCVDCQACDLEISVCKPWTTEEQFALLRRYLKSRHPGGGMAQMDELDFADMVEQTPVKTNIVEYREASVDGRPGKLIGACLTDVQSDGLSMVYSFFETEDESRPGLGTFIILDHIRRAAERGLAYVYLGYWVDGSPRMQYKTRFQPLERLSAGGWHRFEAPAIQPQARENAFPAPSKLSQLI